MANRKVRIVRDVKLDGEWTTLSLKKAQKLKIPAAEGRWYITWREGRRIKREQARDHGHAIGLQGKKHAELHATAFGIKITPDNPARLRVEKAFDDFIRDQELLQRAKKTVDAYRAVKRTFLKSCSRQFLDEITRLDLLEYSEYLRKKEKLADRTVHTRWTGLMTVLKYHNVRGLAKRGDTPKFVEEKPEAYEDAELNAIFKVMKPEYDLLFSFLLRTGFRKEEVMYLKWSDINFGNPAKEQPATARVKAKPEFKFRIKTWEERSVPIDDERLLQRLEALRKHRKATDLVFPTRNGKPNGKMLVALKRIARKAKQDEDKFILHKFRATAATNWVREGVSIPDIQFLLGHKTLAATMRYLAPLRIAQISKSAAWKAVHAGA